MTNSSQASSPNIDELDLIDLIGELWKKRVTILFFSIIAGTLGALYSYIATPIYEVRAELVIPTEGDLLNYQISHIKETSKDTKSDLEPEDVFALFLEELNLTSHKQKLSKLEQTTVEQLLGYDITPGDETTINSITRDIIVKGQGNFSENTTYIYTAQGANPQALKKLAEADLKLASNSLNKKVKQISVNTIKTQLNKSRYKNNKEILLAKNKIKTRELYLNEAKINKQERLKQAIKISQTLELKQPSKLSNQISIPQPQESTAFTEDNSEQQASNSNKIVLSSSENPELIYLRGEEYLKAELDSLQQKNKIKDNTLSLLKIQLLALENEPTILLLEEELKRIQGSEDHLIFYNTSTLKQPKAPVKPKKSLTILASLVIGGIFGGVIAFGLIIFERRNPKT